MTGPGSRHERFVRSGAGPTRPRGGGAPRRPRRWSAPRSVTNEVWLSDRYVVRVNRRPNQRLRREASLGPLLPAEVGYPTIEAYGGQLGADWLIVHRVPGRPLSRCWPDMTRDERRTGRRPDRRHAARAPPVRLPRRRARGRAAPSCSARTRSAPSIRCSPRSTRPPTLPLRRAVADRAASASLVLDTCSVDRALRPADASCTATCTFENVLWDGHVGHRPARLRVRPAGARRRRPRRVPALLRLPVPARRRGLRGRDPGQRLRRGARSGWPRTTPSCSASRSEFERLRLYSIAYDVRELLAFPPTQHMRNLSPHHPLRRLERTVDGLGHLDQLAGSPDADALVARPGAAWSSPGSTRRCRQLRCSPADSGRLRRSRPTRRLASSRLVVRRTRPLVRLGRRVGRRSVRSASVAGSIAAGSRSQRCPS